MKKALKCVSLAASLVLAMAGCNLSSSPGYPFEGKWYALFPGMNDLTITSTSFSASGSLASVDCSIEAVDTGANHIQMLVTTAGAGIYIGWTSGATIYMTYSVSGNQLTYSWSSTSYPSTATDNGPFTKQ